MSLHKFSSLWLALGLAFLFGACSADLHHTKSNGVIMEPPKALPLPPAPPGVTPRRRPPARSPHSRPSHPAQPG